MTSNLARVCATAQPSLAGIVRSHRILPHGARHSVLVFAEINTDDTPGVASLLDRDFKEIELNEDAFVSSEPLFETSDGEEEKDKRSPAPSPSLAPANLDKQLRAKGAPQRSKEAIAAGLQLFEQGKFLEASEMFELALELPGSGVVRLAGSPKEYACPSDGEESTALYNMACCYCKLGKPDAALTCLKSLLNDTEFDNYHAIRTDPDLAPVRGTELDSLLSEHDGLFSKLFGKKKGTDSSGDRSWLQRW